MLKASIYFAVGYYLFLKKIFSALITSFNTIKNTSYTT